MGGRIDRRGRRAAGRRTAVCAVLVALAATGPVTEGSGARPRSAAGASGRNDCASCHRMDPLFSHPVDVVPAMNVPDSLPLADDRIDCVTCHVPHGRGAGPDLLRPEVEGPEGCAACHRASGIARGILCATALGRAHLEAEPDAAPGGTAGLDGESVTCLGCHDGSVARDIVHAGPRDVPRAVDPFNRMTEHPIGVGYRANAGRSSGSPLVPRASVDPRIRLFDQRVGCGSCHSPYSTRDDQLVMSNERSRLCLSCHDF